MAKAKIARATGVAAGVRGQTTDPARAALAQRIQDAMLKAIEDANAKGISDPDEIRARMLKAREDVKKAG